MSDELALLRGATRALEQVTSASDAWDLARTAEAARRYAQLKGLGHEAINYATGIKAKAMLMLADFVDEGQSAGSIASNGRPEKGSQGEPFSKTYSDLGFTKKDVHEARRLREALGGADVDELVSAANASGDDLGIRGLRRAAAETREPEPVPEPIAPKQGRYSCIVIDPPWPMQKINRDQRPNQGTTLDYPVMTLEQIADEQWVPVRTMADDDCHLYLWVTHRFLRDGLTLLDAWGFSYQCLMTWRKNVGITPYSWMYDTEHVIFARRGNLKLQRLGLRLSFDAPVVGHSVKPDVFYERVVDASPSPRLEMFARAQRDGFESWGNEVSDVVRV